MRNLNIFLIFAFLTICATAQATETADNMFEKGLSFYGKGDHQKAAQQFKEIISLFPEGHCVQAAAFMANRCRRKLEGNVVRKKACRFCKGNGYTIKEIPCPRCKGRGAVGGLRCIACRGTGKITSKKNNEDIECPHCGGDGLTGDYRCLKCGGFGKIKIKIWCSKCNGMGYLLTKQTDKKKDNDARPKRKR